MDLTNLQALLNDQKAGSGREWTSHQLAFRLPSAVTATLRTDWGTPGEYCGNRQHANNKILQYFRLLDRAGATMLVALSG